MTAYTPTTGARCACRPGDDRDNCPSCEGTGRVIDFRAIRAAMMPGQTPYTPDELARLGALVRDAADGDPGEQNERTVTA